MATTSYLSQPGVITLNTVDVRDQVSKIELTLGNSELTTTAFGDTGEKHVAGLQSISGTITMYGSYGAGEVEATLFGLVGAGTTAIVVRKVDGALSASNPEYSISNTQIAEIPVSYQVGELQMFDVTFSGGTWTRAIA